MESRMTKKEILDFLRSHKPEMQKRFGVVSIGLFGSYAREEADKNSDIDLVVRIESENSFRSFFGLKYFLEESLHRKIDLGIEDALKAAVKERIQNEIVYA